MTRFAIDFAEAPRHRARNALLLALAALLWGSAAWGLWDGWQQEVAESERLGQLATPPAPAVELPPERLVTIGTAVARLNAPWGRWLADLESQAVPGVVLLGLDITADSGDTRLQWQAEAPQAVAPFLDALQRHPRLGSLLVVNQDLAGVAFSLEGRLAVEVGR